MVEQRLKAGNPNTAFAPGDTGSTGEWIFQEVVCNTIPPDKDGAEAALRRIESFYRALGVRWSDCERYVAELEREFYGGNRVGQTRAAERIQDVDACLRGSTRRA